MNKRAETWTIYTDSENSKQWRLKRIREVQTWTIYIQNKIVKSDD